MPSVSLVKRVESLERLTNTRRKRASVVFACPDCGQGLALDDPGSRCGTHPSLPAADLTIKVVFGP